MLLLWHTLVLLILLFEAEEEESGITNSRFCFGTSSQAIEVLVFRKRDKLVKMLLRSRFDGTPIAAEAAAAELSASGDEGEDEAASTDLLNDSIGSGSVIGSTKLQGTLCCCCCC